MRRPLRKRDFVMPSDPILEDVITEEAEEVRAKIVSDDEDAHLDVDEENLNDDDGPIIENPSGDSTPESEDPGTMLEHGDNEFFMDDVLLGRGRSTEWTSDIPSSAPEQVYESPEHNSPPPPHTSASLSVTEVDVSQTSIPHTTSTSDVVDPKTTLLSGSYLEVNFSTSPIFSDSTTTFTTPSLNTSSTFSFPTTSPSFTIPSTQTTSIPSSTTTIPPSSTSGHTPSVCDPLTSCIPTSTFAGISSNYDFFRNLMTQHESESYFGGKGFISRPSIPSGAGPTV